MDPGELGILAVRSPCKRDCPHLCLDRHPYRERKPGMNRQPIRWTMNTQRRESKGRRGARGRIFLLEPLEDRRLLAAATEAFTPPSLSGLISQAYQGKYTAPAAIKTMLSALQSQLTDGPLAYLSSSISSGTPDGNGFVTEAQSLVYTNYNQNVDQ